MRTGTIIRPERTEFLNDVRCRLEQTKAGRAVQYSFTDKNEARKYRNYTANKLRTEYGNGSVLSSVRQDGGTWLVFFSRGDKYPRAVSNGGGGR